MKNTTIQIITTLKNGLFFLALLLTMQTGWGQITEGFETGMPLSYTGTAASSSTAADAGTATTLGSGSWKLGDVIQGTTKHGGSYSAQIHNATGACLSTPVITNGVGTVTFWAAASSTSSAGVQLQISTDGGSTYSQVGSTYTQTTTFLATNTFYQISAVINNPGTNIRLRWYRTAATIYIDDVTTTTYAASTPSLAITGTTAHSTVCPSSSATPITYTITNSGSVAAAGVSVVSSDAQFVVSGLSSTTIAASGGTATYTVTFTPSSSGSKSATITVSSTTSGSNSPTSSLTGTGTTPVSQAVTSTGATSVVNTTATLNGNATFGVCPATTIKGFVFSKTSDNSDPLIGGTGVTNQTVTLGSAGAYTFAATGLTPGTQYKMKAYVSDGTNVVYSPLQTFTTLTVATKLAFGTAPPSTATGSTNLTSFTVVAQRADNTTDTEYTGGPTASLTSSPSGISGTTTASFTNGVATFSAVQFSTIGTYTITANSSTSLTSVTSGNIVVGYCASTGPSTQGSDYFTNFTTTGGSTNINNTSTFSANGYGDFTNLTVTQAPSGTVNYSATSPGISNGSTFSIFVDWNRNGLFTDSGENVVALGAGTQITTNPSGSFTVPSGATLGSTRMRIIIKDATGAITSCNSSLANSETEDYTFIVASPTINGAATATAFTTTYGTASAAQTFAVSGSNLTANLVATAPTGFEVSSNGTTYGATATFTQTSGSASGTLSVRLKANAAVTGSYNAQNIVLSSTGATSVNITTSSSGNVVSAKGLTITANDRTKVYGTSLTLGTAEFTLNGIVNSETVGSVTLSAGGAASTTTTLVGTYPITASAATGGTFTASNYTITYVDGTLTITKANQTITAITSSVTKSYGDATYSIATTASSGLTVTYSSSNSAVASVSTNGTVTILTPGSVVLTASQSGDSNYNAATDVTQSLTINPKNLTINGITADSKSYDGNTDATISGTPSLVGVVGSDDVTVVGTPTATFVTSAVGTGVQVNVIGYTLNGTTASYYSLTQPTLSADIIANTPTLFTTGSLSALTATYGTASSTTSFNVSAQSLTEGVLITSPTGFELSSNGGTTYANSITVGTTGNLSSTTILVRLAATSVVGTYSGNITLSSAGATSLTVATVSSTVSQKGLTISGLTGDDKNYDGLTTATVSGTATLNGVVGSDVVTLNSTSVSYNFTSATAGNSIPITVLGYTLNGADAGYYSLTQPSLSANINKSNQTLSSITATVSKVYGDAAYSAASNSSSGLTVSYSSSNTAVATINAVGLVTIVGVGTTTITASQAGNTNYNAATSVTQALTVDKANQTISALTTPITKVYGDVPYSAATTSSSGLTISYSSSNTAVATVDATGLVTIVGVGTTTITASQSGNSNYNVATSVTQVLTVNKVNQTITFNALPTKITTDATITLTATATSNLTVTYSSSNTSVATVLGNVVTIVGPGITTITASQAGDSYYNAAADVPQAQLILAAIAKWTFEGISVTTPSASLNISSGSGIADMGSQTSGSLFSSTHASASTVWTNPTGNGSAKSITSDHWAIGDYWQFKVKTSNYKDLQLSFDTTGSNTGPNQFKLQYSIDGTNFSDIGSPFAITNDSWSSGSYKSISNKSFDLSAISDLIDKPSIYIRVVNNSTTAISGTFGTGGTNRIDNFLISGKVMPQGTLTANGAFCGTGAGKLTFTATSGTGPFTVVYNDGVADRTATNVVSGTPFDVFTTPVTATTTYTLVSVTDATPCARTSGFTGGTAVITVNPLPTITLGYIDDVLPTDTSFSIPFTATTGNPNKYSLITAVTGGSSIVMPGFTAVTNATLGSSPIAVTIPASSAAEYGFILTVTNSTTGCSKDYPFQFHVTSVSHGVIGTNQTICTGATPAPLTSITPGSTSDGDPITYTWEQSTTGIDTGYAPIIGETGEGYAPGALTQTTYFKRVTHYTGTNPDVASDSDPVTITVSPTSVAGTAGASVSSLCPGNSTTLTLNGYTGTIQWQQSADGLSGWATVTGGSGATTASYTTSTLNATTYYRALVTSGACSSVTSNVVTITVNPSLPASVSVSSTATSICAGSSVTFTATPTNGGSAPSYQWKVNGTNVGTDSTTYTATTLADGDAVTVVMTSNASPCLTSSPATSSPITMTVLPLPTASVTANNNPALCGSDVTFTVTGTSGAVLTYNINGGSNATTTLTAGTATITVSGAATTQTLTLVSVYDVDGNGCSALLGTSSAVAFDSTTWNGTAWSNGDPDDTKVAIFTGNATINGTNLSACTIKVTNNAVVSVDSGVNVYLNGALTVDSGATFTLNNNANLYQSDPLAQNSGNVNIKRNSSPVVRLDYTLWSSPVAGQGLLAFSPLTTITPSSRFYTYNTNTNLYDPITSPSTTNFDTGKGYLIRVANNHPTWSTVWTGTYTGVPNNGTKIVSLSYYGGTKAYNAVGNPYPSPISVTDFVTDNASAIEPTLYFWRKSSKSTDTAKGAYCTLNTTSNTFTSNGVLSVVNPNGVIQTGQGFVVKAKSGATSLVFNNNQRTANNDNQFFRTTSSSATATNEAHRIWLNLTGAGTEFSQTVVGYFSNATLGVDDYDSKFFNDGDVALNTKLGVDSYAIQGRPVPFDAADVVPLNYKATTAGTYTFAIDHVDGLFTGGAQAIYIKDNSDGSYHDITSTPFTFTSAVGTFDTRFELVYQNGLLHTDDHSFTTNDIAVIHQSNNDVVVRTGNTTMKEVRILDIRGRLLVEQKNINASETRLNVGTTNQVLLVEVTTTEGYKAVRKVLN